MRRRFAAVLGGPGGAAVRGDQPGGDQREKSLSHSPLRPWRSVNAEWRRVRGTLNHVWSLTA